MPIVRRIFTALAVMSGLIGLQFGAAFLMRPKFPAEYALMALAVCLAALLGRGVVWIVEPLFRHHEDNPLIPTDRR
jgi:hypothetical protein